MASAPPFVEAKLKQKNIVIFSKSYSPEGKEIMKILPSYDGLSEDRFEWINIDKRLDVSSIEDHLWKISGMNNREVPLLFVKRVCWGGYNEIMSMHREQLLQKLFDQLALKEDYSDDEYDQDGKLIQSVQPILVKLVPLDETEVVVRVADWISSGTDQTVDYDAFVERDSTESLHTQTSLALTFQKKVDVEERQSCQSEPEWMYVGGTQKHQLSHVSITATESSGSCMFMRRRSSNEPTTK